MGRLEKKTIKLGPIKQLRQTNQNKSRLMSANDSIDLMCTENMCECLQDILYETLKEFIERVKDVKEARDALSKSESMLILSGCVQNLFDIAYQATTVVPWTSHAKKVKDQLRCEIDGLDNWGYFLDYLQLESHENPNQPFHESMFSFEMLSTHTPDLYADYLCKLNDLITFFSVYDRRSEIASARQAVKIGRISCALANTLLRIMQANDYARKTSMFTAYFSVHLLITPMLMKGFQVCHTCIRLEERETVWDTLRVEAGYTEEDIERLEYYTIVSLRHPIKPDGMVGFAVINHDVAYPFRPPKQDLPIEFQHPYVDVRYLRIDPDYRRYGAGRYLMSHIKKSATENNYEAMAIDETDNMLKTKGFWKAMGFKESKHLRGWRDIELNPKPV